VFNTTTSGTEAWFKVPDRDQDVVKKVDTETSVFKTRLNTRKFVSFANFFKENVSTSEPQYRQVSGIFTTFCIFFPFPKILHTMNRLRYRSFTKIKSRDKGLDQWSLTWGKFTPWGKFHVPRSKFTEP